MLLFCFTYLYVLHTFYLFYYSFHSLFIINLLFFLIILVFLDILLFLILIHFCFGFISIEISIFVWSFVYVILRVMIVWVEWFRVLALLGRAWVSSPHVFLSGKPFHFWKIPPIHA